MPALTYKQKSLLTEITGLFILTVVIPFFNGSQVWPGDYASIFSLIFLNCIMLPVIILYYRWLLPFTIGRKRYGLFLLLFPVYLLVYEMYMRLSTITGIHTPFLPERYRHNLTLGHPENFSVNYIHQIPQYTLLVLLFTTSLYMIKQAFKTEHQLYTLENDKLRLELSHLKSQLQPHFFFNTLNNLYALSTQGSPKTSSMIADLSDIMRYVLYESEHEKVLLEKEINFIKSYIELERLRHTNTNIIDFDVQGGTSKTEIEPLLFLPIIENAFKHSLAMDIPGKYVKMVLTVDENELIFQTANPYKKDNSSLPLTEMGGIGLKNVKKRLELLYPGRHQLDIDMDESIFVVILTIRFLNKK